MNESDGIADTSWRVMCSGVEARLEGVFILPQHLLMVHQVMATTMCSLI